MSPSTTEVVEAGTGHRPNKVFTHGYRSLDKEFPLLVQVAEKVLRRRGTTHVISGGAQGWDQALAQAAINLDLKLTMALPYRGFGKDSGWPQVAVLRLELICGAADEVVFTDEATGWKGEPGYHIAKLQIRNQWMTDNSTAMIALWDGGQKGGTWNNIQYARKVGSEVDNVWADWLRVRSAGALV